MIVQSRCITTSLFLLLFILAINDATGQIINVGSGSYTTQFPGTDQAGRNSFPSGTPFTTGEAANKPVPTNDWWSAQIKNNHTDNLFNYPYTLKSVNNGLVVSYIPWGVIDDQLPVIVGVEGLNSNTANVSDFSDWTVSMQWSNQDHQFEATSGIGMPFLYFSKADSDEATITVNEGTVSINEEMILIENTRNGADFAIYGPSGSEWVQNGSQYKSTLNGKNYWSMAFLPSSASNLNAVANEYKKYAYVFPTNTSTQWNFNEGNSTVRTDFNVDVDVKEGSESTMLIGLLPHQWNNLASDSPTPEGYSYPSIRGELKMLDGNSFSVENQFYGILPTLPYLDNYSEGFSLPDLEEKVQALENEGLATWTDSYNQGQEMNRLIQTARIADLMGNTASRDKIIATIKSRLEDWLTAELGEVAFLFYYNETWSALLGYPAGHGQDENINDHHFHWGYFIHAAAFMEQFEPGWAEQWGDMINLLVTDAANANREDEMYPFLRNFSPYAGHCWANGFASFPQGNDQESTSESMQFNSSLIHWGAITGNDEIRDLGIYLYTTEQTAIEEYWFDMYERNFAPNHPYSLVSRVWGNSYDNGTFWTSDIAASYGIELYPIHGGSLYLGHHTDYVEKLWTEITQNTGILNNEPNVNLWHDLMWEYLAFIDPQQAIDLYDSYPDRDLKFGVSDAQTYHWLHSMNVLGEVVTITSDNPLAAVFDNDGEITYVAHNYKDVPVDVTFSDGYIFTVPAMSMATSRDLSISGTLTSTFEEAYPGGSVELNVMVSGGIPDYVEFYNGNVLIGQSEEAPYNFKVTDLPLGVHTFYAKIYQGTEFRVTNTVSVRVGDQVPFQNAPIEIPGTIQSGHYDIFEGGRGQNIAYNDITPENIGDFRLTESVDAFSDSAEGDAVGWISAGEWLEYSVNVKQAGNYSINIRYSSGNTSGGGPLRIESDGRVIADEIQMNFTGDWNAWSTTTVNDVPLKSGEQVLRLHFENGEFNLGRLTFEYNSPLDFSQPIADAGEDKLVVLPEVVAQLDGSSSIDPSGQNLSYSWEQIYGPSVLEFSDITASQPTISTLEEGVYLLKLTVSNGTYSDEDEVLIISSLDSNFAPEVLITSPSNGTVFYENDPIQISAEASDLGGFITQVEFFVDGQSIGVDETSPYQVDWTNVPGEYIITATATDNDGGSTTSEEVTFTILKARDLSGIWRMVPEVGALGVGPVVGDIGWWQCDDFCIADRACFFDDEYIFEEDGTFRNLQDGETWIESWQDGNAEGCRIPVAPHDGTGTATWSLTGNTLTISGTGAYIGLAKVINGAELSSPANAPASISYPLTLNAEGNRMSIDINFGPGFWHFELEKEQPNSTKSEPLETTTVYPNPVDNMLYIDQIPVQTSEISIYNNFGQLVERRNIDAEMNGLTMDMSHYTPGIYFLTFQNKAYTEWVKIIKAN